MKRYPLKFHALLKEKVWGGRKLARVLGKNLPSEQRIGESWEVSGYGDDVSIVANGPYQGMGLHRMVKDFGEALLGTDVSPGRFPLLFKFVDAADRLSVQVHPDDVYARRTEHAALGKTEAWVIVDARPGARLVRGLEPGVDSETFRQAIEKGRLDEILHWVEVSPGDVIFVPAGQVHAIGKGILLYEVQQSSDSTYRVYDWGRPRPLHIEKALEVTRYDQSPDLVEGVCTEEAGGTRTALISCRYFVMERWNVHASMESRCDGHSFHVLSVLDGHGEIGWEAHQAMPIERGESLLLPAQLGAYEVSGNVLVIRTYVPSGDG
jgi:mannose-6-phosphate isomerase